MLIIQVYETLYIDSCSDLHILYTECSHCFSAPLWLGVQLMYYVSSLMFASFVYPEQQKRSFNIPHQNCRVLWTSDSPFTLSTFTKKLSQRCCCENCIYLSENFTFESTLYGRRCGSNCDLSKT